MKIKRKQTVLIMLICSVFLFLKYIAQLFPSLIGESLMKKYSLDGLQLGVLASSYYYSYSTMQIISGIILDKLSIRLSASCAMGLLGISLISFAHYHSLLAMCISRVLMGISASFATVLYMKCAAIWTSSKTFGLVSSFLATATMLGAAAGGAPLSYLFSLTSWEDALIKIALCSIVTAVASFIFIPGYKSKIKNNTDVNKLAFKGVLLNKQNWMLMCYSGLAFAPIVILGGLWGMPFLKLKYGISTQAGAYLLSIMFLGLAIGAPIWSFISMQLQERKSLMQAANIGSFLTLLLIIYCRFSYADSIILFFILGFCVGCFMLSFQICRDINPFVLLGMSFAFMNIGEGIVGSLIEPTIGEILDILKPVDHAFTISNFQHALLLLPLCYVAASIFLNKLDIRRSYRKRSGACLKSLPL